MVICIYISIPLRLDNEIVGKEFILELRFKGKVLLFVVVYDFANATTTGYNSEL